MSVKMNGIELYAEAGAKAGLARKRKDEANAQFHTNWMRAAIRLESPEYAIAARKAFDDAYREQATPKTCFY